MKNNGGGAAKPFRKRFITNPEFYKGVLAIALPIALQNLIVFGVSVTDTMFLGQLGEVQLSASAQANQPQFILNLLTFGLAGGGTVLTSQYWGKRDMESVRRVIGIVVRVAVIASLIASAATLLFPRQIMQFYLKDEAVIEEAVKYLRIVGWGYFFFGVTNTFISIIRSVELVKISVVISSISFLVNVFLDYVLIFGNWGFPKLGIEGAAWGTLTARITEFILITIYALFIDKRLQFRVRYIFQRQKTLLADYIRYSIPVVANELAWGLATSLQAAILGNLSTQILSANSISSVLQQLSTIAIFGAANACCVVVGKRIGEGRSEDAVDASFTMMAWSVILGFVAMLLIFFLRKWFVSLYHVTAETRALTENLLILTSVVTFFVSIAATSIMGVLRGAGDTRFALKIELAALWLIALPLGCLAGFAFHAPILLTYALLKMDEPIKAVIGFIRTTKADTYRNVTRSALEEESVPLSS